jgi:hypothetical protein
VEIKKTYDLDNAWAKSRFLEALLAQAVAMQIISTPVVTGRRSNETCRIQQKLQTGGCHMHGMVS